MIQKNVGPNYGLCGNRVGSRSNWRGIMIMEPQPTEVNWRLIVGMAHEKAGVATLSHTSTNGERLTFVPKPTIRQLARTPW